jgi:transcriptional regulator with XRE-family HTH domain
MPKRPRRPSEVTVSYRGIPFILDLVRCRRALVGCQIAGKFDRMEELADAVGVSRSTVSRFFAGRETSLTVTKKIVAGIGLKIEDVLRPAEIVPRGNTRGTADGAVDDAA